MNKKLLLFGLPILALGLVAALTCYTVFNVNVNVNQPIQVTGNLEQTLEDCEAGEICAGELIRIDNFDDEERTINIVNTIGDENIDVTYLNILELTKKDTSTWEVLEGEFTKMSIVYTIVGETFEYFEVEPDYTLIYYKDAVVGLEGRLVNPQPAITIVGDIGNLPQVDDANSDADYSKAPDYYAHPIGAKLWAVPTEAINSDMTLNWAMMADFYYETDLVYYFANSEGEITIPSGSFIEFYPTFTPDEYIAGGEYIFQFEIQ